MLSKASVYFGLRNRLWAFVNYDTLFYFIFFIHLLVMMTHHFLRHPGLSLAYSIEEQTNKAWLQDSKNNLLFSIYRLIQSKNWNRKASNAWLSLFILIIQAYYCFFVSISDLTVNLHNSIMNIVDVDVDVLSHVWLIRLNLGGIIHYCYPAIISKDCNTN
jgi:hypothetical protein